jgi:hypothetical protein
VIRGLVRFFCKFNVEALSCFGVEAIGCAKKFDGLCIVLQGMKFRDVEIVPNAKLNKDKRVGVKTVQGALKILKSGVIMNRELSDE